MPSGKRWSWRVSSGVLALALAGCQYYYETPRPAQFTPADVDMVAIDSIVKYGRGLDYDSVYGAADSQRVDFATGNIGSGDWAIIQPEKGAWALDEKEVAEGRIIARIRSHAVYAPFGYGPWWTYWWVDKKGGQWRSILVSDVKLGRRVAIKLLAPATRAYLGSDRFQREVLLAAQLSHPHIVPLFEADEADGLLFYVMEYVEGESLRHRLTRQGSLPVEDAIGIAAEVGDALQYAHENGVIHRDIKPENILLSRGHALVTDFGIAKLMEERGSAEGPALTGAGIAVGTAAYMSPEQASGDKRIDPRSDVYALAAVLYEMLAGEPPFTGPSAQAIAARVINDPPRPIRTVRPALPVHLERALAAGLAKSPADRPRTARTFVDALASPARERRVSARQVAWMATASGVAIIGWMVWRGWRIHPPPGMVLVPAGLHPVGGRGAPRRGVPTLRP